jgi:hypothetical protein
LLSLIGKLVDEVNLVLPSSSEIVEKMSFQEDFEPVYNMRCKQTHYMLCLKSVNHKLAQAGEGDFSDFTTMPPNDILYVTAEIVREAFWRTLRYDRDYDYNKLPSIFGHHYEAWHLGYTSDLRACSNWPTQIREGCDAFDNVYHATGIPDGRRFCLTIGGRIGWVPERTEKGDRICVFRDGSVPCVICPRDPCFEVIGECYIHDLMDGEALETEGIEFSRIVLD